MTVYGTEMVQKKQLPAVGVPTGVHEKRTKQESKRTKPREPKYSSQVSSPQPKGMVWGKGVP